MFASLMPGSPRYCSSARVAERVMLRNHITIFRSLPMATLRAWSRRTVVAALAVAAGLGAASGRAQPSAAPVTVFAAASLKNAMDDVIAAFTARSHTPARASYGASSALARQIEQGAPADVFVSADVDWMDYLARPNLIVRSSRVDLLSNHLALIAPA